MSAGLLVRDTIRALHERRYSLDYLGLLAIATALATLELQVATRVLEDRINQTRGSCRTNPEIGRRHSIAAADRREAADHAVELGAAAGDRSRVYAGVQAGADSEAPAGWSHGRHPGHLGWALA
jgi:hypothetical protein